MYSFLFRIRVELARDRRDRDRDGGDRRGGGRDGGRGGGRYDDRGGMMIMIYLALYLKILPYFYTFDRSPRLVRFHLVKFMFSKKTQKLMKSSPSI